MALPEKKNPERLAILVTFLVSGVIAGLYAVAMYPEIRKVHHAIAARTVSNKVASFLRDLDK